METTTIINIVATILVLAGFTALAIPVSRFNLSENVIENKIPENGISIVVAFRNEIHNLPALYESICNLNYPKHLIEWVLCNDHSEDGGKDWILQIQKNAPFRIVYCENKTEEGKKAALNNAVNNATYNTLFFTDADCILPPSLLQTLNIAIQNHNTLLIAGPIKYNGNSSFLHNYQCMESAVLMALTAESFKNKNALMANGANLCMNKSLFVEAQSKRIDLNIPGGDDIFLLEYAMQKNSAACSFIFTENNIVKTASEKSWSDLINQRVRWASKVRHQKYISGIIWQGFSFLFSISYIASIILIPFIGFTPAGIFTAGKMAADVILYINLLPVLNYKINPLHITIFSIVQVLMIMITGIRARFGGYYWKGSYH